MSFGSDPRAGDFATARRGALDWYEIDFITCRASIGVPARSIAQMLGRPLAMIQPVVDVLPKEPRPEFRLRKAPVRFDFAIHLPDSDLHEVALQVGARRGVSLKEMKSRARTAGISQARMEAMARGYALGGRSNLQVAMFFNCTDHTTCNHARKWWAKQEAAREAAQRIAAE